MELLPIVPAEKLINHDHFQLLRSETAELKAAIETVNRRMDRLFYAMISMPVVTVGLLRLTDSL